MLRIVRSRAWLSAGALGLSMLATSAHPAGLQIAPVSLTIKGLADTLWLSNTASTPMNAQVRVYRWTQQGEQNREDGTAVVLASPPIIRIAPAAKQAIRVVRTQAATAATPCEETYRLRIDEILDPVAQQTGLRYRLSYSVPIFFVRPQCIKEQPALTWSLDRAGAVPRLVVRNAGLRHARLSALSTLDSNGKHYPINPGLVGYVLPGATMAFPLRKGGSGTAAMATVAKSIEVTVNGSQVVTALPLASPGQ